MQVDITNRSFKIADNVVISKIEDELVLLNLDTGIYFKVNDLGSFIISELKEYITMEALQDKIILNFNVSINKCRKDLLKFIQTLQEKDLLDFQ